MRARIVVLMVACWLTVSQSAVFAQTSQFPHAIQPNATLGTLGGRVLSGSGSPEGVVVGWIGDLYLRRTDGGAGTVIYIKASGVGTNTGWIPQGASGNGVGNAALAWTSATTVNLVERDSGADPSADTPVILTIGGQERIVTAAQAVVLPTDLDTGSETAGTNYYIWATRDGLTTGIALKLSISKTAPTGLTTKLLLGGTHNNPSSDLLSNSVWSLARQERDKEGMAKAGDIWIDIYEGSVWTSLTGGTQKGASSDDYGCADTGNDCSGLYARSVYNVTPSRYLSWFQAARVCAASGKHLVTDAEWQMQALGTAEAVSKSVSVLTSVATIATATIVGHGYGGVGVTRPVIINGAVQTEYNGAYTVTVSDADTVTYTFAGSATSPATGTITAQNRTDCIVSAGSPYGTGTATACKSWANTYDSVGNLWEWTGNWFAGTRALASPAAETPGTTGAWGPGLIDTVWNVRGAAYADGNGAGYTDNIPAAGVRGGGWVNGAIAGVFSLNLGVSPWSTTSNIGFRCAGR